MIIVSDSSPLHYLILIGQVEILRTLFGEVVIPPVVVSELTHERAPEPVRAWVANPKAWLRVQSPTSIEPTLHKLDPGEIEAISLAKQLNADAVLIDDRRGMQAARGLGLVTIGTLAIIERAAHEKLLDLSLTLDLLLKTNFRAPPEEIARLRRL